LYILTDGNKTLPRDEQFTKNRFICRLPVAKGSIILGSLGVKNSRALCPRHKQHKKPTPPLLH
jgi:hypothetical protein